MKKILFILALLLALPSGLWADSFTRVDCGTLTGVAIGDDCLQTSNVNGRLAGRTYAYNGSAWIEKAAPSIVNAQTGTIYTFLNSDSRKLVTFTNGSAIAVTLPQAGASSAFMSGWFADVQNRGAGTATITPAISTIDGAASLALTTNQGVRIFSDGTNYFTQRGIGGAGGGSGDALTTNPLSQFAATTSAQLASVISNETGSGALVFGTSPTLVTPALGTPTSGVATNLTGLNATQLTAGTVPDARFPATLPAASGVNLTAFNATNLGSGTIPDARFPATLPAASGVNLTALNASNLASGTVPTARLPAASDTASGIAEAAIAAEVTTGTDAARYVTPLALAGSTIFGLKTAQVSVFDPTVAVTTGDGMAYFVIPRSLNGMNLVGVRAHVNTVSSSGAVTVDLTRCALVATGNTCSGTVSDILSTNLTINANQSKSATAAAAAVIDAANDDVATDQVIRIDVDGAGTGTLGLIVILEFQLP